MKDILLVLLIIAIMLLLIVMVAFNSSENTPDSNKKVNSVSGLSEWKYTLSDGRIITCIVYQGGYAGGLDCDWK